jgi:hypothetical protein
MESVVQIVKLSDVNSLKFMPLNIDFVNAVSNNFSLALYIHSINIPSLVDEI